MAFKLDASIVSQIPGKKTGQSWVLYDMKSVGIWDDDQLTDTGDAGAGTFLRVAAKFASMSKGMPDKKKPVTFSWSPTNKEEKMLFRAILRSRRFEMRVGVKDQNDNFWGLHFGNVKLTRSPITKKNVEYVEATFVEYYQHP